MTLLRNDDISIHSNIIHAVTNRSGKDTLYLFALDQFICRNLHTIEQRQEELEESHTSFVGEIQSRDSALDQLKEGMEEIQSNYVKKKLEVAEKEAVIRDQGAAIKRMEEMKERESPTSPIVGKEGDLEELRNDLCILEEEMDEIKQTLAKVKIFHRTEVETLDQEKELLRFQLTKKIKTLLDIKLDEDHGLRYHHYLIGFHKQTMWKRKIYPYLN